MRSNKDWIIIIIEITKTKNYNLGQDSMGASEEVEVNPNGRDTKDSKDARYAKDAKEGENEIMSFEETSLNSSTESGKVELYIWELFSFLDLMVRLDLLRLWNFMSAFKHIFKDQQKYLKCHLNGIPSFDIM